MAIRYEWDIETITSRETDEHEEGEVLDHNHCESYKDLLLALAQAGDPEEGTEYRIVLVRDDDDRRAWAVLEDGKLPEHFSDADGRDYHAVPKRFHDEVARAEAAA